MQVELEEGGEAKRMRCEERVHLKDPTTSRDLRGTSALYEVGSGEVHVRGAPAVMRGKGGTEGRRRPADLRSR